MRVVKGFNVYDPVIATEICLVLNVVVPKGFRVLKFIKYTGLECPNTHLRSYYNKIVKLIHNDKLLIHFFQDNLIGSALSLYITLDTTRVKKWSDLGNAFLPAFFMELLKI